MRKPLALLAIWVAAAAPLAAQLTISKPPPGGITSGRPGIVGKLGTMPLIVHYPQQDGIEVALDTTPALKFSCQVAADGSSNPDTACRADSVFKTVQLRAGWRKVPKFPLPLVLTPISGPQWQGDCTGTAGDTCILNLGTPRSVQINFNGGAIGIGVATGSKND